jgi:hypothetical protein
MRRIVSLGLLAVAVIGIPPAQAQSAADTRTTIERKVKPGDRLTITGADGMPVEGRLLVTGVDTLVVRAADGERAFAYGDIDRVRRRNNGVIVGAIVGTAAGLAVGLPLRTWWNNEGSDGDRILWTFLAAGAGIGTSLDALMTSNRTVYRRPRPGRAGLEVQPQNRGGVVRWSATW